MRAQWESEKGLSDKFQQVKESIEQLNFEAERAEREGNYGRVAEIRYSLLKQKEDELNTLQAQLKASLGEDWRGCHRRRHCRGGEPLDGHSRYPYATERTGEVAPPGG